VEAMAVKKDSTTYLLGIERNEVGSVARFELHLSTVPGGDTGDIRNLLGLIADELHGEGTRDLAGRLSALVLELADQDAGRKIPAADGKAQGTAMATKRKTENAVLEQARVEFLTLKGELEAIKARLLKTGRQLRKAAAAGEVVDTELDGTTLTLEGWIGDYIGDAEGGLAEGFNELIADVARQADFEGRRAEICNYAEHDRRTAAKHQAKA
jgi:hypothetical protein